MKARIKFKKNGSTKFIGHLDVMRYFQKAMRRAEIPIAFTKGFSPHMIMSFAQPLGIGLTSDGEYFDIELEEYIDPKDAILRLNKTMAEGMEVTNFVYISDEKKLSGMTITAAADYHVYPLLSLKSSEDHLEIPEEWSNQISAFMDQEEIIVLKKTKKSEREVNIRPMIYDMRLDGDAIYLFLATGSEQNLKPDLVMETFLHYIGEEIPMHYHRLDVYAKNKEGDLHPLDSFVEEVKQDE